MDFAPLYLFQRFFYRFFDFFHHWYVDGSRVLAHRFVSAFEIMDRDIALKVTVRYFFQPLYRDYTVIGRVLGVIFRTIRIVLGLVVYLVAAVFFLCVYLVWIAIPAIIIFNVARNL